MKKTNPITETIIWVIALLPLLYLWLMWSELPERVPVHFNLKGEADGWASKKQLVGIVLFTTVGLNLLMRFIPGIDPKQRLANMGGKYHQLRFIMVLFMAALAAFSIYNAMHPESTQINYLFLLIGGLLVALGNYFQAVKPNYFIGIRTPWTLESEQVWRKTHRLGGILWVVGGLVIVVLALLPESGFRQALLLTTVATLVVVPLAYSFIEYKKEQRLGPQS